MLLKKVIFPGESASHQLELIMKTINPPDDTEIEELCKSIDHQNVDLIKKYLQQRGVSLSDTFINFDCSTVDIIERLLRFTPNERLTVEEVLNHPYIQRYVQLIYFIFLECDSF
jgi:mitogen-activated protein kinase 15